MKRVFALELREQGGTLVACILGFKDEDDVAGGHLPPLPNVVEANAVPYRRLVTVGRQLDQP